MRSRNAAPVLPSGMRPSLPDALLHVGQLGDRHDLGLELLHDRRRRALRRGKPDEALHHHAVDADLGQRRHVGKLGQARRAGGGERPQVPALNCGIAGPASANVIVACPVITAVTSSAPPLNGMCWNFAPVFWLNSSEVSWNTADVLA